MLISAFRASLVLAVVAAAGAFEVQRLQQHATASVALKSKRARKGDGLSMSGMDNTGDSSDDDSYDDDKEESPLFKPASEAARPQKMTESQRQQEFIRNLRGLPPLEEKPREVPAAKPEPVHLASREAKPEPVHLASKVHPPEGVTKKKPAEVKEDKEDKEEESTKDDDKDDKDDDDEDESEDAKKARKEAKDALEAAEKNQDDTKQEIAAFKDDEAFAVKVTAQTKLITNETQSPALAGFLGELRTAMREYAMPVYPKYLQSRLDASNAKIIALEAELKKAEDAADDEEDDAKAAKPKSKKEKKEKKEESREDKRKMRNEEEMKRREDVDKKRSAKHASKVAGETVAEAKQKAGETWAISFFANIAMLAVVFGLASAENRTVKNYTWFLIDQVVVIFLAVMYFQAFDSMLSFQLGAGTSTSHVISTILHALFMLAAVLGAAFALRTKKVALGILCGAGAHVVSFTSIHAAATTQGFLVGMSYTYLTCIFAITSVLFVLLIIAYLVYTAKKRAGVVSDDSFMDPTDDLENDFGSMATSVCITMLVRFILTGHHPVDDETGMNHTAAHRMYMFIYACTALCIAPFIVVFCSKKGAEANSSYAKKRICTFVTSVATMMVAWAWLYWGEWEFFGALYPGQEIKGRVMFAITMTMVGGVGIIGLSKIGTNMVSARSEDRAALKSEKKVALTALSLVVAWSWELCFDASVEVMCEGSAHPVGWKVATAVTLACIVIPIYAVYMRPITTKAAEEIGA